MTIMLTSLIDVEALAADWMHLLLILAITDLYKLLFCSVHLLS